MLYVRETPNGKKQYVDIAGFRPVTEDEIKAAHEAHEQALLEAERQAHRAEIESQIVALKYQIAATDYKQSKWLDGALSEEEYAPIRTQRQEWRDEINRLEQELASL